MRFGFRKRGIEMLVVLAVTMLAGAAHAQSTTTTETKSFEILAVRGNVLVIREPSGTRELTVPSDFHFKVDGKNLPVTELRAGMKGTATVTKTTISVPVYVTDVKNVTVTKTLGHSVIVQDGNGDFKMYAQGDIDQRGINVIMDGKPVRFEDLQVGDRLTASIVTEAPPQKMSKTEVDVALAKAAAEPTPSGGASAKVAVTPAGETPVVDTTITPTEEPVAEITPDTSAVPATAPASNNSILIWLGLIALILVILLVMRRRSKR